MHRVHVGKIRIAQHGYARDRVRQSYPHLSANVHPSEHSMLEADLPTALALATTHAEAEISDERRISAHAAYQDKPRGAAQDRSTERRRQPRGLVPLHPRSSSEERFDHALANAGSAVRSLISRSYRVALSVIGRSTRVQR